MDEIIPKILPVNINGKPTFEAIKIDGEVSAEDIIAALKKKYPDKSISLPGHKENVQELPAQVPLKSNAQRGFTGRGTPPAWSGGTSTPPGPTLIPPNINMTSQDPFTHQLGAALGGLTGGPTGMLAGASSKTPGDVVAQGAFGLTNGITGAIIPPAKNWLLRMLQGSGSGILDASAASAAKNAVGEPTEATLPSLAMNAALGAVAKTGQGSAIKNEQKLAQAQTGLNNENLNRMYAGKIEAAKKLQKSLNSAVETKSNTIANLEKTIEAEKNAPPILTPKGVPANLEKIAILQSKVDKVKEELAQTVKESAKHPEKIQEMEKKFAERQKIINNTLDNLKIPSDSPLRQVINSHAVYMIERAAGAGFPTAAKAGIVASVLRYMLDRDKSSPTLQALADFYRKKTMNAQMRSQVDQLIPLVVNSLETTGAPQ